LKPLPSFFIRAPFCLIWLIPLTWLGQRMMDENLGPDTAAGILIWPPIFYYYGIFVLFGALCFGREEFMKSSRFGWLIYLLLAAAVGFAAIAELDPGRYRDVVQPLIGAAFVWLMSFGLIGMFRLLFNGENRKIRWLSDSAYWLYLAHLPLMMAIQIWVSDWEFPLVLKFLFVILSTTAVLLILYQVMIRYSFIGTILNGKKVKPAR
jgi:peptidoglycan/LPS O-acetylase OafA/YrhL